ncbi:MAG: CPBP family intramembrane metalloprotease [Candidatus Obscuribacterales bacterium]|nr:CPBP family intramembrane metalloprotease [Candidatus Obscuribacterales bacterium]
MPAFSSYLILAIAALTIALPFMKGEIKRHTGTVLILGCTLTVLMFFSQVMKGEAQPGKIQAQVDAQRYDSGLRFMSLVNVGTGKVSELFGPISDASGKQHNVMELSNAGLGSMFKKTSASLQECIKSNPVNTVYKAKLIVLLSVWGQHKDLLKSSCHDLQSSNLASEKQLGDALAHTYIQKDLNKEDYKKDLDTLESEIPKGWFKENAVLALHKAYKQGYNDYLKVLESRYVTTAQIGIAFMALALLNFFIGIVVIIVQLGSLGRNETPVQDSELDVAPVGLDVSLRTVYAVFVGWISSQVAIGQLFKLLPKGVFSLGGNPLGISVFSLVSYMIEMIPAFLLIYFLALRPNGLNPIKAMALRWKTPGFGPIKLAICGYLGWCAILPLVMMSALIANTMLGSQGSDNPILAQISAVVESKNTLAIFLLFFTVAVMAPLCEEIIFRGFLYSALKTRLGILPAVMISAIIFAGIHMDKGGALMLMALGPVLALALDRTRSIFPSMIAHGLWNGGAFAVTLALFIN